MQQMEVTPSYRPEYNWVDGAEPLEKYAPGGYHPVMIDDILSGRYRLVEKLGFGGYSTVWLAQDVHMKRYVAVKIGIADSYPREMPILRALTAHSKSSSHLGCGSIPLLLDEFELHGPNGSHPCYTMPPALCNLREISFSRLFPINIARALAYELTLAVSYVHSQGYVHGGLSFLMQETLDPLELMIALILIDIHLRNVLVKPPSSFDQLSVDQLREEYGDPETVPVSRCDGKPLPPGVPSRAVLPLCMGKNAEDFLPSDARVLLSDFGESFAPSLERRPGKDCHTPLAARPPEARFEPEAPLSYSADIWSLALAIWEILGMKAMFSSEFICPEEVVSNHIDVLGPLPTRWFESWEERHQVFAEDGRPQRDRYVWPALDDAFEKGIQKYRRKHEAGEFSSEETASILNLMRRMLSFKPEERLTAEEVLKSEWMVKWALPDYEAGL